MKIFGENVSQKAELKTFQLKHEVGYGGRKIDPPEIVEYVDMKTTTNAANVGDFSIIYSFRESSRDDLLLVERLSVSLNSQEALRAKRLTEKIQPPESYEHVSLEPTQVAVVPDSKITEPVIEQEVKVVKEVEIEQDLHVVEENMAPKDKSHFVWIIGGVLLLGLVVILVRFITRGRAL